MAQPQSKFRNQLIGLLKKTARDKRLLSDVLSVLFTTKEQEEVARRLEILRALDENYESQRTIATRLGVSIATVTRQSRIWQEHTRKVKKVLEKL